MLNICFVEKGFHSIGFDIGKTKIDSLKFGKSDIFLQ